MRSISVCLLLIVVLYGATAQAQSMNYLLASYDHAIEMHNQYEQYVENFRKSLNVEAADFGLYFTEAVASAIERSAQDVYHGTAIQSCAGVAALASRDAINRFDEALLPIQQQAFDIHFTVIRQLMETNIKENDLELFYYYHNYRMDELYNHLYDELLPSLYDDLYELWDEYFVILGQMETCLESAIAPK